MARTKTKPTPRRRRCYNDDFTPMSYQGWVPTKIREELKGWITDPGSLDLFVRICELLKPKRIERITYEPLWARQLRWKLRTVFPLVRWSWCPRLTVGH